MPEVLIFSSIVILMFQHRFYWCARKQNKLPRFMAHRGIKIKSPENSLAAYQEAVDSGFQAIEMDIVSTHDGQLICSHNFDLERETTGSGWIHKINKKQLEPIKTGIYSHPNNSQSMPTFLDAVNQIPPHIFLNIEIKTHRIFDLSTAKAFIRFVKFDQIKQKFIISCFNPFVVAYFRLFHPKIPIGFLIQDKQLLWLIHWIHPDFLHPRADMVDDKIMGLSREHKLPLNIWTVNNLAAIDWCCQNKIAGVITDNPNALHRNHN
ncbi:MAG: hypothetical protein CMG57_03320 [Candidatus Marinimicrobia bacterium]|nr:hypothetical protein [Candidatus Neomarinimicrobiota bacterium]|tara:strand:- start:1508 stop:2299 length:792 start_codon:yes stop_codon:yes gene_type:complete